MPHLHLTGLDFGSTTMRLVAGRCELVAHAASGRLDVSSFEETYRSEPLLTPFEDANHLDLEAIKAHFAGWIPMLPQGPETRFSAIVTGLAAKARNLPQLCQTLNETFGSVAMIHADDPRFESWLAFMGGCKGLMQKHRAVTIVNLDIGGGTTNVGIGAGDAMIGSGSFFIGARHIVLDRDLRLLRASPQGLFILQTLAVPHRVGDPWTRAHAQTVASYYVDRLEDLLTQTDPFEGNELYKFLIDASLSSSTALQSPFVLTLSGGVGELVYDLLAGQRWNDFAFGDLGVLMAREILQRTTLTTRMLLPGSTEICTPRCRGRATLLGVTLHKRRLSGATTFQASGVHLPLQQVPLLGWLRPQELLETDDDPFSLGASLGRVAAYQLEFKEINAAAIRSAATALKSALEKVREDHTVVFLLKENLGKTLGNYLSAWGQRPRRILVIDEIDPLPNGVITISAQGEHFIDIELMRFQP